MDSREPTIDDDAIDGGATHDAAAAPSAAPRGAGDDAVAPLPADGPAPLPTATAPVHRPDPLADFGSAEAIKARVWARTAQLAAEQHAPAAPASVPPASAAPVPPVAAAPASRPASVPRQSFLRQHQAEDPARHGWKGFLNRFGARFPADEAELTERADVRAVSQHWPLPRTVAVVNGKGGVGKTPSTAMLAAAFARHGAGVLAWENNQTRGTLGWRTEQGPHDATLLDLLPHVPELLGPHARAADLAGFTHHQMADRFDVLRAQPTALAAEQRIEPHDVSAIHEVASKYYRLIVMDSGNDESDPMWQQMVVHTDQIVVATTTRDDHAEAGALLLEALMQRDPHSAALAQGAVVVVTQADPAAGPADVQRVAEGFGQLAREVVTIPFDPAMVDGLLRWDALRPVTRRAWLAAGAAVARGL